MKIKDSFDINTGGLSAKDSIFRDITADRGNNTGVLFLNGSQNRYLYYNGSAYEMPGAHLFINGSQAWTTSTLDSNSLLYNRGTVATASIDNATTSGYYTVDYGGYSTGLLVFKPDGSLGVGQIEMHYSGNFRFRNKTDNNSWASWKDVWHTGNFNPSNYAPLTGAGTSGTWSINISGNAATASSATTAGSASSATIATKASTLAQNGGNGAAMTFHWDGQSGTPTWVWGGSDGTNHYVYNPANFSVNHATTSGSASVASETAYSPGRTDSTAYPVLWGSGSTTSPLYSCSAITIQSSTGTLNVSVLSASTSISCGNNISANGSISSAGLLFGRSGGGLGLGRITTTTTTGSPSGTSAGDLVLVY